MAEQGDYQEEMGRIQELLAPLLEHNANEVVPAMLGVVFPAVCYGIGNLPDQQRKLLLDDLQEYIESREIGGHPVTRQFGVMAKSIVALMGRVSSKPPGIAPDDVKPMP